MIFMASLFLSAYLRLIFYEGKIQLDCMIARQRFFFIHHAENQPATLVPDFFFSFKKAIYEQKIKWSAA